MGSRLQLRCGAGALLAVALASVGMPRPVHAAEPKDVAAPADEPTDEDTGPTMLRYPPSSVRFPLIAGGGGLFAVPYAAGMISGFVWGDVPGADALKVPVVGPWIALGQSGCAPDEESCGGALALRTILTTLNGLAQLAGLALVAEGIFMTTEAEAETPSKPKARGAEASAEPALQLGLAPVLGPTVVGIGISGRY